MKIALIGAGSRSFGAGSIRDILLSDALCRAGLTLVLMDLKTAHLKDNTTWAEYLQRKLGRRLRLQATTNLERALAGADFVITAIERDRYRLWCQDFHVPRHYGFKQVFGENGGPGSLFHALRNMGPMVEIARTMERQCPQALLLNFSNPEHKLCEAVTRLTTVRAYGLCHGVSGERARLARLLGVPEEDLETVACGINHFCVFQVIRRRSTGEDLYPKLRLLDRQGDPLALWHEVGLGRIILRRFGLWPAPGANHYGEYLRWATEFVASELHFYYDPADGPPWRTGRIPEFVYSMDHVRSDRPWRRPRLSRRGWMERMPLEPSGEYAVPIMEAVVTGRRRWIESVIVPNHGYIPNLQRDMAVEVPAWVDGRGVHPVRVARLPEALAALMRLQGSIQQLLVEAFAERSRDKLLQAMLLEPTVDSYHNAVACVDEMLALQKRYLPRLRNTGPGPRRH